MIRNGLLQREMSKRIDERLEVERVEKTSCALRTPNQAKEEQKSLKRDDD